MSQVGDSSFATAYASGSGVKQLPVKLRALVRVAGSPRWVAAGITADKSALHVDVRAAGASTPAAYRPALLSDVPSGAILAVIVQGRESAARTDPGRAHASAHRCHRSSTV